MKIYCNGVSCSFLKVSNNIVKKKVCVSRLKMETKYIAGSIVATHAVGIKHFTQFEELNT